MPKYSSEELDALLKEFLELPAQASPARDINLALRVADLLEANGYAFRLKDMCPQSMDSLWQASFSLGDKEFRAEDAQSAMAVSEAALIALQNSSGPA